jgi:hypothetical protein
VDSREKSGGVPQLVLVRFPIIIVILCAGLHAQSGVEYVGGTAAKLESGTPGAIQVSDERYFAFYSKKVQVRVAYDQINELAYGQKVDRRLLMAVVISPVFLLSKKRKHFLTVGYTDDEGHHQALVFQVDKNDIRATLASLEARTGVRIQYQDEDARKAGHG